jgi:hypothetical protein
MTASWFPALIATHVILATSGYAGLIVTNAWLLMLCRNADGSVIVAAVNGWRRMVRIFGPLLGVGMLAGFALALLMGMPLSAAWLIATYVLVLIALGAQAALMVPWQRRAQALIVRGAALSTRPIAATLALFCVAYAGILSLMVLRP